MVGKKPDEDDDDDKYFLGGTYKIRYNLNILDSSYSYSISDNTSKTSKSNKQSTVKRKVHVPRRVMKAIQLFLDNHGWNGGSHDMVGYTSLKMMLDGRKETFRATDEFHGSSWYDWCMVEWTIGGSVSLYPSKIHAFVSFEDKVLVNSFDDYTEDDVFAVIQSSVEPLLMSQLEEDFISSFDLGFDAKVHYQVVPVETIAYPLYVFENYNGLKREHFCALPRRKWARYFGNRIQT